MAEHQDVLDLGSWCVLRMASADTMSVYESLRHAGFEVWTPLDRRTGRMPRTRAEYEKLIPLMPSYVFAHVQHIGELARIAMVPSKEHPRFTMFRHLGAFPLIADAELDALRAEENRRKSIFDRLKRRRTKGPVFDKGAVVHPSGGGFEGLSGVVEGQQGKFTLVSFAGFHQPIQISSLLLEEDGVGAKQSDSDVAARAA